MKLDVTVNGEPRAIAATSTIADLVTHLAGPSAQGIAVARNREVVPRSVWQDTELLAGDAIEVLNATRGG